LVVITTISTSPTIASLDQSVIPTVDLEKPVKTYGAFPRATLPNIDILYGTGHGTFTQGPLIPTNSRPTGLAVGDFNSDGKLDLVVGGTSPSQLTIMTQP
jgi:FG-GAP-like repeat